MDERAVVRDWRFRHLRQIWGTFGRLAGLTLLTACAYTMGFEYYRELLGHLHLQPGMFGVDFGQYVARGAIVAVNTPQFLKLIGA